MCRYSPDPGFAWACQVGDDAFYAQVATNVIRAVTSPLDQFAPLMPKPNKPPAMRRNMKASGRGDLPTAKRIEDVFSTRALRDSC
jgi:hypothetical protein